MKQFKLMMMAALAALMSSSVWACISKGEQRALARTMTMTRHNPNMIRKWKLYLPK